MLKTNFEELIDRSAIGNARNPILLNDILKKARKEQLVSAVEQKDKILFLGIDIQQDFMDNGALGVPGAMRDVERIVKFLYKNIDKISDIAVSIDTHMPYQIFHPCWWVDKNGNHPEPYTIITLKEIEEGKWNAVFETDASKQYVENLEKRAKKQLCIWNYHCLEGTSGCALENQFANMIYFHSVVRKTSVSTIVKGKDPLSEMYGIIEPEYSTKECKNLELLDKIKQYKKVIVAGEAKSHCVLESVKQILEHYQNQPEVTSKFYILEDGMSSIPGFEVATEKAFQELKEKYKIKLVKTTDCFLEE